MPAIVSQSAKRLKLTVRGAVQGVGFRPFVYRLATDLGLRGWVNNSAQGVFIEVEGPQARLEEFRLRLEAEKPPRSFIQSLEASWLDPAGCGGFEIRPSEIGGGKTALVLPDIATCPDCLREIFDAHNRRHFYPFTNCTNCGPRFSIIEALPYDRANTSMKGFTMCPRCRAEYEDPRDRRFHAQPNACPVCGPRLELWDRQGKILAGAQDSAREALALAAEALRAGKIVAVKGLGGFHLMVAARDDRAVRRLRELKHREEKPFAVMSPSMEAIKAICAVSPLEERLLRSSEAPIVLLRRISSLKSQVSNLLAPNNPNLGVMLPYTPLHHLLLSLVGLPVVATSGNLSDEPICTDEHEALERLGGIADLFLVHNRPIVRHVDDSITRVMAGRELVLRRARGYAPLPVQVRSAEGGVGSAEGETRCVLAVGAHLKNTVALSVGRQIFISQHIGDLETDQAFEAFRRVIADFETLYDSRPNIIAADAHPDYLSTQFARTLVTQPSTLNPQLFPVQHHVAHVLACMAENELEPPVLGVSWDGTGYGSDGTIWGGEFFLVTDTACERVAHLRQFRLPGGDKAVKEPRRTALGLLYEMLGDAAFARGNLASVRAFKPAELAPLKTMLARGINSPLTSSVGRLFDAVASLVGLRQQVRFEGQAALELEFALDGIATNEAYPLSVGRPEPDPHSALLLDWSPTIQAILADIERKVVPGEISVRFHNGLVEALLAVAREIGQPRVVLSGGCFQNRYLTERAVQRLQEEGFRPYWHQRIPPNDGGIALGQAFAALRRQWQFQQA
jgi:hydrogenase maturation protein HypF